MSDRKIKKFKSVKQAQKKILIKFMEDHPEFANGFKSNSSQGRQMAENLWKELANKLNSNGLPMKTVAAWRKAWTDYKYRAKRKCSQNLLAAQKTGGGPNEDTHVTPDEEKVIAISALRKAVSGSAAKVFGAIATIDKDNIPPPPDDADDDENFESPSGSRTQKRKSSPLLTPVAKHKKEESVNELLKQQMTQDAAFQTSIITVLTERNQQEAVFHSEVLRLLKQERNLIGF